MKIELEVDDLTTLIDGLNNAIIALSDIRNGIFLMGGLPSDMSPKWNPLVGTSFDDLTKKFDDRLDALKNVYDQLCELE